VDASLAVVEDDHELRGLLKKGLTEEGFRVVLCTGRGGELLDGFDEAQPDVVVLDVGLPDADGRDVLMALRARGIDVPVLLLTARSQVVDRLSGFHAGADDYLTKPFAFAELVVRLQALARRTTHAAPASGSVRLDPARHTLGDGAHEVLLTPTEFRLLATLVAQRDTVVRRRALVAAAWPDGAIVHENTLDAYLGRLRRKLGELDVPERISTVRGVGYRFA
jgi:two-component system response regulator MprA